MVAQSGGSWSITRHVVSDVFEVEVVMGQGSEKFRANPAAHFCSCGEEACNHLGEAAAFLHDHRCPVCKRYEPFCNVCGDCIYGVERDLGRAA